ncbi:MAG: Rrf2 family transcriptional regulator [Bacteroidetes bacterium]|nr:Rrf2 family transcriptional regulator [Bacteroidota bacterium]
MKFNKTAEYALRILSYMATDETRLYRVDDIRENLNIPFRYLRRLMTKLTKKGLLISIQGKKGGYKVARNPGDITLMDIIISAGSTAMKDTCFFGFRECPLTDRCVMHDQWMAVKENIMNILNTTRLSDLKASGQAISGFGLNK